MSSFKDGEFVTQYAIRMPDGTLYGSRAMTPADMLPQGFMMGPGMVFGMPWGDEDDDEEIITPPAVWYDYKEAERALEGLRMQAKQMGIEYWHATIEERLCSPFTTPQGQAAFVDDITTWLKRQ
ncbi:MAG TPA: hypothetical protein VH164_01145 [Ktedonobacteraceae bacterium]|jgi:hypothetical protein|nr:hypothetical protein [Ktedonobacteraceae bacterium]